MGVPIPKVDGPPPKPSKDEGGNDPLPKGPVVIQLSDEKVPPTALPLDEGSFSLEFAARYTEEGQKARLKEVFISFSRSVAVLQIYLTLAFILFLCPLQPEMKNGAKNDRDLVISAAGLAFGMGLMLYSSENVKKYSFLKFISFLIMTVAEALILVTFATSQETMVYAFLISIAVCVAVARFALQTKWDFSAPWVTLLNIVALIACVVMIGLSRKFPVLEYIYGYLGVFVHSVSLGRDVQEMTRDYKEEDEIPAYVRKGDYVHGGMKGFTNFAFMLLYMYCILPPLR